MQRSAWICAFGWVAGCSQGSDDMADTGSPLETTSSSTSATATASSTAPGSTTSGALTAPPLYLPTTPSSMGSGGAGPGADVGEAGGAAGQGPMPTASTEPTEPDATETTSESEAEVSDPPSVNDDAGANTTLAGDAAATEPAQGEPVDLSKVTEEELPSLLSARQEHSVVALDGEIYVIGGYTPQATDSVEAYDPVTQTWRTATAFPERLNHGNAAVVDGKIYVAGYYIDGGMSAATNKVYAFDPLLEEWAERTPMPEGTHRAASCVCVDSGLMYVIAGARDGMSVDTTSRYDVAGDSWEALPVLPERREHCVAGVIGGTLYVAGGRADRIEGIEETTWALDLSSLEWSERAPLSPPRGGLGGAVMHGRLFVFGGEGDEESQSGVFSDVNVYDPVLDSWDALEPMIVPRHGFNAAVLDDRIYVPGGADVQGGGAADASSVFYFEE